MRFYNRCKDIPLKELEDLQAEYEDKLETIYYWIEKKIIKKTRKQIDKDVK